MGVRGLATFIQYYSDKYLENHNLKNCTVVIDGNSLACQIYKNITNFNSAFGGDYDKYAVAILDFFAKLKKCKVAPILIFDGGYEKQKLDTARNRLKQRWRNIKNMLSYTDLTNSVFPCFLKEVFKNVVKEKDIPVVQCLFEADAEIAALARNLNCPVISYDSDFFVYNVLYIPFPTLHSYPMKDESTNEEFYLKCKIYRVEHFLKCCGGLQKEVLPFLCIMLGCDYVGSMVYKFFVKNLKRKNSRNKNLRHRKIASLLEWLETETVESVRHKVIQCLRKYRREKMEWQIEQILSLYSDRSSALLPILGLQRVCVSQEPTENNILETLRQDVSSQNDPSFSDSEVSNQLIDSYERGDNSDISDTDSSVNEDESKIKNYENNLHDQEDWNALQMQEMEKASHLPHWFVEQFQKGEFPSCFMDMFIHKQYFLPSQIEDFNYHCSHMISFPLISVIFGLIVGSSRYFLRCHLRGYQSKQFVDLFPVLETSTSVTFPTLENLPNLSVSQKMLLIMETTGTRCDYENYISSLPLTWHLYFLAFVYWVRETDQPQISFSHIEALFLCLILLDIAGSKEAFVRSKKMKCSSKESKLQDSNEIPTILNTTTKIDTETSVLDKVESSEDAEDLDNSKCFETVKDGSEEKYDLKESLFSIKEILENLSFKECVNAKNTLRPYCIMQDKLKTRPKLFCVTTVHSFAQFQSVLLHFVYLNSLLGYPFLHCQVHQVFSGTFLYNMYHNLKQRANTMVYISQLLSKSPNILTLFRIIRNTFCYMSADALSMNQIATKCSKVSRKKKGRRKKNENAESKEPEVDTTLSVDSDFEDPSNRFAALSLLKN